MRFVPSRLFETRELKALPRATAPIRSEPSPLHPRQLHLAQHLYPVLQPGLRQPQFRQQSLRRVWSILEMVGVGVTMAAFMAMAMF